MKTEFQDFIKEKNRELYDVILEDLRGGHIALFRLIDDFVNKSKWINKQKELPSNGETVLVYLLEEVNGQRIHLTSYSNKYGFESVAERLVYGWQPLPEKP